MAADPELIALFVQGWAMTRAVAPPIARLGGHYLEVGQPDQRARYVFARLDADIIAELGQTIVAPWIYLKVCVDEAALRPLLPARWVIRRPPTYMMTGSLVAAAPALPGGYGLTVARDGAIASVTVGRDDAPVARGRIALLGGTALFDQISTDEAHRRRGLGRAMMQALSNLALDQGAASGLLSATEMGRALYETIGWTVHSPYTSAVIPA
jgi:GNAT superfamily N-acetyltransferase